MLAGKLACRHISPWGNLMMSTVPFSMIELMWWCLFVWKEYVILKFKKDDVHTVGTGPALVYKGRWNSWLGYPLTTKRPVDEHLHSQQGLILLNQLLLFESITILKWLRWFQMKLAMISLLSALVVISSQQQFQYKARPRGLFWLSPYSPQQSGFIKNDRQSAQLYYSDEVPHRINQQWTTRPSNRIGEIVTFFKVFSSQVKFAFIDSNVYYLLPLVIFRTNISIRMGFSLRTKMV